MGRQALPSQSTSLDDAGGGCGEQDKARTPLQLQLDTPPAEEQDEEEDENEEDEEEDEKEQDEDDEEEDEVVDVVSPVLSPPPPPTTATALPAVVGKPTKPTKNTVTKRAKTPKSFVKPAAKPAPSKFYDIKLSFDLTAADFTNDPTFDESVPREVPILPVDRARFGELADLLRDPRHRHAAGRDRHRRCRTRKGRQSVCEQVELGLRVYRWARFYGVDLNDPHICTYDEESLDSAVGWLEVDYSKNRTRHGYRGFMRILYEKIYVGDVEDEQDNLVFDIIHNEVAELDFTGAGPPDCVTRAEEKIAQVPSLSRLIFRADQQRVLSALFLRWWRVWSASATPSMATAPNPFFDLPLEIGKHKHLDLTIPEFVQLLVKMGMPPGAKNYGYSLKRAGWPGYARFGVTVLSIAKHFAGWGGIPVTAPVVQHSREMLFLARILTPEPIWLRAFSPAMGGTVDTLQEVITRIETLPTRDPDYSEDAIFRVFGYAPNGGLGNHPYDPRVWGDFYASGFEEKVKYMDTDTNELSGLMRGFRPRQEGGMPSALVGHPRCGNGGGRGRGGYRPKLKPKSQRRKNL